jgi:murein DD-endopeptidase MepM/ murein hydrolase activator NlpD
MPFGGEDSRVVSQGVDGETTHQGDLRYSFDFAMPVGTPVLAAREGYVVEVIDKHGSGRADPAFVQRSNVVLIGHADGSIAQYSHLSRNITVKPGDVVSRGQEIARSGNSGYTHGPHLHFAVSVQASDGRYRTVPVRFASGHPDGLVPVKGRAYAPANSPASVPAAPE